MAPAEKRSQYPLYFRSKKLRDEMQRLANQEHRSLNEIINIACEEFVAKRKDGR